MAKVKSKKKKTNQDDLITIPMYDGSSCGNQLKLKFMTIKRKPFNGPKIG